VITQCRLTIISCMIVLDETTHINKYLLVNINSFLSEEFFTNQQNKEQSLKYYIAEELSNPQPKRQRKVTVKPRASLQMQYLISSLYTKWHWQCITNAIIITKIDKLNSLTWFHNAVVFLSYLANFCFSKTSCF
jgi:hypothetical protein